MQLTTSPCTAILSILGLTLGVAACDSPPDLDAPATSFRASDDEDGDDGGLDAAPYRVALDAKESDGLYETVLDLKAFDPERPPTLFMISSDESGDMRLHDLESGEGLEKAGVHAKFEDEGGTAFVSKIELGSALLKQELQLVAEVSPASHRWLFLMCDEVVTTRGDMGPGSLRQAIADVRNGGSVCFDPVEFATSAGGPVQLSGEILIGKDVIIHGTGPTASTVTTNGQDRILQLGIGTESTIDRLGLHGGAAVKGGLLLNRGELTLEDCDLHSGQAERGGAIHTEGDLYLERTDVSHSTADYGGGIHVDDALVQLLDSSVQHNLALHGGGVYGTFASFRMREGTKVMHNEAEAGGGVYIDDWGISGLNAIWGGSITGNVAATGGGVYMSGGHLQIDFNPRGPGAPSAISGNLAEDGGGIYVGATARLEILLDNAIEANAAERDGGGIYNAGQVELLGAAQVIHNDADRHGGGVYNEGDFHVRGSSRIADNAARHSGGGAYNASSGFLKIWDSPGRIENNAAVTGGGSGAGGGVANAAGGILEALSHEIVGNSPNNFAQLP